MAGVAGCRPAGASVDWVAAVAGTATTEWRATIGSVVRRILILTSIVLLITLLLATTLLSFRYVMSGAGLFAIATLLNMFGRPLVAIIFSAVLVARFRDIWSRRVDVAERAESGIARLAQTSGMVLLVFSYAILIVILFFQFFVPRAHRAELPIFFIFAPLLTSLPIGYFLFELGRLIDIDRRQSAG